MFKTRKVIAEIFSIVGAIRQQCTWNLLSGGHTVKVEPAPSTGLEHHSHSIVPGGFDVMSYTTRLIPRTSLTILLEIVRSTSYGSGAQSAVIPSSLSTARIAHVFA